MDQDAFRILLAGSHEKPNIRPATASHSVLQQATTSEPTFKPRKVKKAESKYRDRAAERREGIANDYAQVEAVLEDFQKRVAHEDKDVIEQQRKYLGGDSEHSILVKGLDMSLFEQNRARAATSTEDDDILEQAFAQVSSTCKPTEPRKRTREDILRNFKAKQQNGDIPSNQAVVEKPVEDEMSVLQEVKKAGKFRPIGFKPIGRTEEKVKKRKVKEGKEGVKKKKQKIESAPVQCGTQERPAEKKPTISQGLDATDASSPKMTQHKPPEPEPTPVDENFDIFAGAGDYEGFPDDDSEAEERDTGDTRKEFSALANVSPVPVIGGKGWFDEPELEARQALTPPENIPPIPETTAIEEEPLRLKPLESSVLPSIHDFLAMSEAAEKAEKRKTRKEKKKKKKKEGGNDDDDD